MCFIWRVATLKNLKYKMCSSELESVGNPSVIIPLWSHGIFLMPSVRIYNVNSRENDWNPIEWGRVWVQAFDWRWLQYLNLILSCVSYQQVRAISSRVLYRRGNNSVPSRPDTLLALLILQLDLRSEAIRLQMEASFLSCSSDERESLYWCGESALFDHFPYG